MVRYLLLYNMFVQIIHDSDYYQNTTKTKRMEIDELLNKDSLKKYFGSRLVPQLTLHESFVLGFANSDALQKRTYEEQNNVMKYLKSDKFKNYLNNLEGRISKLVG